MVLFAWERRSMVGFLLSAHVSSQWGVWGREWTARRRSGIVLVHLAARRGIAAVLCIVCVVWKGVLIGGVHLCLCVRTLVAVGVVE